MNNIIFAGVNMLSVYRDNIPLFGRIIADVMKCLADGIIRPVQPLKVMNFSQIEEAFRIMQTGKHIGKMVLSAQPSDLVPVRKELFPVNAYYQKRLPNTAVDCFPDHKDIFIPRECHLYDTWGTGGSRSCNSLLDGATGSSTYRLHFSFWSNKS